MSSFGVSGTNAHVVLEEAPVNDAQPAAERPARAAELVVLSARSGEAASSETMSARMESKRAVWMGTSSVCPSIAIW